jgi:predicted ATPase/class 3 adenylate cyclase
VSAAPSGVVTFLFTDVEGSTRRWEADAEGMRAALAAHDEVLRGAIEEHEGWLFKHTGDGVCAAFASPRSAVDAAVAAQRALELPVRMGIATGEAELRGADYFGAVLNRAARVMAAGHGGQVLLAESTAVLLSGVDLVDLGPRRLRDLPTPIGVFQVRAAGLRTEFPALRALDASPGNLRAATTSFIGRESEVAELQGAVKAHRLVTLTGVGGVGKTRLVSEEQLWRVPSLDVNSGTESAAVNLFVDRAQSVVSDFSLAQPGEADAVVEICRRLDGIPLAIELAASRMASMTASDVRDRLDHRFRLLVGSRRGLSRHQTLRHAVAWSYHLLDDAEKPLLERCSVFAGGFDLESACAVMGSDDEFAILDLLDALVRKSLLLADRSSGHARFSMLETIRQFAEEQLADSGAATEARTAHARYFAGREADILALWDSPRQREAYDWFTIELPNLRTAFRWAADQGDLDAAVAIATYAAFLGMLVENREPIAWAEELIEPARVADHPRLAFLYVMATQCGQVGRTDDAVRYADAAQLLIASGRYEEVPFGGEAVLAPAYDLIGQPERAVEWCRAQLARGRDTHTLTRACLVTALTLTGSHDEARAAATGLIDAAEATHNPAALSLALYAHDFLYVHHAVAFRDADPVAALDALRRGLVIAQDSGNRFTESLLAVSLCRLEAVHGDPLAALDHITLAIRTFHDSGNTASVRGAVSILAAVFDRLGRYEPAATMAGFAVIPFTAMLAEFNTLIAHLRDVLGDQTYESLARKGEAMTTAAMATYAYDQIDQARAELNAVSK